MFNNVQLPTIKTHNVCTILYNVWLTTAKKKSERKYQSRVVGHCVVVVVVDIYIWNYDEIL